MRRKLIVSLSMALALAAAPSSEDARISHALNRLTFGARPGDLEQVRAMGLKAWIDQQLHPDNIAENPVHLHDLHATILHCLGIDHDRFSYKFRGLNVKLTGVEPARVVKEILI